MGLVSVIGVGRVGSCIAEKILTLGIANIVLIDVKKGLAEGEALDLNHMASIMGLEVEAVGSSDLRDIEGSDVVVISAGYPRTTGMSREDLIEVNAKIVAGIANGIKEYAPKSKVIVVTNPVDALTYIVWRETGFDRRRVVGFGSSLDAARLKYYIAREYGIKRSSIDVIVAGQHGDKMTPLYSVSRVNNEPLKSVLPDEVIVKAEEEARRAGSEIIRLRGFSSTHAPAAGVALIVESILLNEKKLYTISVVLDGEYGVKDSAIGVPCIIGSIGVDMVVEYDLGENELKSIRDSAERVKAMIEMFYGKLKR